MLIYFSQKKELPAQEIIRVPNEAKPVHEFVTTCLTQIAKDAVVKIGMQGGYLEIPKEIEQEPTSYLSLDSQNIFKLPYWYYEGQDRIPAIQDMQNSLTKYVLQNSDMCTQQFEKFAPATIEIIETIKPETIITQDSVVFKIKWPMTIKLTDRTTKIGESSTIFTINLPVKLKQAWQIANAVMQTENKNTFFENRTIDFMSANENIPTDGLLFECGPKRWHMQDIKKELQETLHYTIPYVRIENTQFIPFKEKRSSYNGLAKDRTKILQNLEKGISLDKQTPPSDIPDDAYEYFKMRLDAGITPTELKASFAYEPEWGIMLAAQPNDGQVLRSNMGKGVQKYLPFICINQWHFTYDIIYPVKLTIKDDTAFLNKGYLFQIAFPVIINTNAPDRVFFGIQKFKTPSILADFCATPSNTQADIRAKGFVEDIPIATELPDVNITYSCFNQYCDLGTTKADEGYYRLRTLLPQGCNNPIITAAKQGYLPAQKVMTQDTLELQLTKLKKINVSVVVHAYNLAEQKYTETTQLLQNQKIAIHLFLRNSTFDQYKEYPTDKQLEIVDSKASYNIDAILTSNGVNIGGYFGEAINFTYADIADKNEIVLHVVELRPHPTNSKQIGEMTQFLYTNQEYKTKLRPELR